MGPVAVKPTRQMRELMEAPGIIRSLGAHDVLTAVMIEQAGFESVFIGGFGTSASLYGLPDLNFLGLADMADAVHRMATRLAVPLIADGDTGYGEVHNVQRTVEQFEAAGAAGIILEDQVSPKRCGHFGGKDVIDAADMALKMKAADAARIDPDFLIIARTDAREPLGLDEAIDRVNRYCDAGGDVAFVEAPTSVEELEIIHKRVEYPTFINMLTFGRTPILSSKELEDLGCKIVVAPIDSVLMTAKLMRDLAETFLRDGHTEAVYDQMVNFDEFKELLGVERWLSLPDELASG